MKSSLALIICIVCVICGCTQDAYDKGEGKYSLMRADFVEAHANSQKQVDSFTTDDGDHFSLAKTFTTQWVTVPDTIYRCFLYYSKVEEGSGKNVAQPISVGQVSCPKIQPMSKVKEMKTDPVKFESAWMSKTGKYLNLSLYLMTGSNGDEAVSQTLDMVSDTVAVNADSTRTCHLYLYHDQKGVPEYYSKQVYVSILTKEINADSVRISINTYKGIVSKTFVLSNSNH